MGSDPFARPSVNGVRPFCSPESSAQDTFFEYQVEEPVTVAPGGGAPRFPDLLKQAGVEGEVLVMFVVDTTGLADVSTFKILKSTHELFSEAVRSALPTLRFKPARVGGVKVKQVVQQPFTFAISR